MAGVYKYKGFYIVDNRNSYEHVEKEKSWYISLLQKQENGVKIIICSEYFMVGLKDNIHEET